VLGLHQLNALLVIAVNLLAFGWGGIYLWRKRFGKLEAADVKRLRHLEQENAKLKKLVAERDLEIEVMKEVAAKKW